MWIRALIHRNNINYEPDVSPLLFFRLLDNDEDEDVADGDSDGDDNRASIRGGMVDPSSSFPAPDKGIIFLLNLL